MVIYYNSNFTLNYKFMTDRIAMYNDTSWLGFDNSPSPVIAFRPINGKVYIDSWYNSPNFRYNTNKSINTNTIYNVTITCNNNIYKWYLNGELIYTYNSSISLYYIVMLNGWIGGSAGDFNANYIFGDIFFADECLIDGNFTVDNTKLFMNELGPGTTLESDNKLYGMK